MEVRDSDETSKCPCGQEGWPPLRETAVRWDGIGGSQSIVVEGMSMWEDGGDVNNLEGLHQCKSVKVHYTSSGWWERLNSQPLCSVLLLVQASEERNHPATACRKQRTRAMMEEHHTRDTLMTRTMEAGVAE